MLLTVQPNWSSPVTERLQWSTNILQLRDGTEQRISLRAQPVYTLEYEFLLFNSELTKFNANVLSNQGSLWDVPLWQNQYSLPSALPSGSTAVGVNNPGWYDIVAGQRAVLFVDADNHELVTISATNTTTVTLGTATVKSFPVGAKIIPVVSAYMNDTISYQAITREVATGVLQIKAVNYWGRSFTLGSLLNSKPIFDAEPNRVSPVQSQHIRNMATLDYGAGPITVYDLYGYSQSLHTLEYLDLRREGVSPIRKIMENSRGKWKSFYAPSHNTDLILVADASAGQADLVIKNTDYSTTIFTRFPNQYIRIYMIDGSYLDALVVNAVNLDGQTERLTLSTNLSSTLLVSQVKFISFLSLYRFESDAIEFVWITPETANVSTTIRRIL